MRNRLLILILLPICVISCGKKRAPVQNVNEDGVITASVGKPNYSNPHFFDAEKYADSVRYVRLETVDGNLVSEISELLFTDDYIIVVDARAGAIHLFDHNGKYSHKIHRRGRGPGEYLGLSRVMVDGDQIIVYDVNARAMLRYDIEGKFISRIDNFCDGMLARDIINLPYGDFLCYRQDKLGKESENQAGLWLAKKDGTFDRYIYLLEFDFESMFVQYGYHLSVLANGGVSFVDQNQTSVFHVDGNEVSRIAHFKLPGKTEADTHSDSESAYAFFTSQEKGDYVISDWTDDKNRGFMTILTKSTGFIEEGLAFSPLAFGQYLVGGSFVRNNSPYLSSTWFYPSDIVGMLQDNNIPDEFRRKADELIAGISPEQAETANPILQLLYIKK